MDLNRQTVKIKVLTAVMLKTSKAHIERHLHKIGVKTSALQLLVLHVLKVESKTINELAKVLMLEPATLVPVVRSLEKSELVIKHIDKRDRRRAPLSVTPKGQKLLKKVQSIRSHDLVSKALKAIGPAKASQLQEMLEQLVVAIGGKELLASVETRLSSI